jgi:hypothetical protein
MKYRVTLRSVSTVVVDADNPYQAAVSAAGHAGNGVEVADVRPASGRPSGTAKKVAKKTVKKAVKKRKPMSREARAQLAKNLVKARAARARNLRAAKAIAKKSATKATKRR